MNISTLDTALIAIAISALSLMVSIYVATRNRNSISVYLGFDQQGDVLYLTNNSPHEVTVVDMGTIKPGGGRHSALQEDMLQKRIAPRDVMSLYITRYGTYDRKINANSGAYIKLATGQILYSRSWPIRILVHITYWLSRNPKPAGKASGL